MAQLVPHRTSLPARDQAATPTLDRSPDAVGALAESGDEPPAELAGCPHCGTLVDKTELKPMRGLKLAGCIECRTRLEVVGHHQRPVLPVHQREILKRLRNAS